MRQGNRDGLSEAFWALLGGSLAALPAASEAVWKAYGHAPPEPLSLIHLGEVVLVVGCAVAALVIKIISWRRSARVVDLVERIRARGPGSRRAARNMT